MVEYSGGKGTSVADAIVILGAGTTMVGIAAENQYIAQALRAEGREGKKVGQALLQHEGRPYDLITVALDDGGTREFYFDITDFFGK